MNPISNQAFFNHVTKYQNLFPLERRSRAAQATFHKEEGSYNFAHRLKTLVPTMALYYTTRVVGTKKFSNDVRDMKEGIDEAQKQMVHFKRYFVKEWIFDSASTTALQSFIQEAYGGVSESRALVDGGQSHTEKNPFDFDVKQITWKQFAMNHAFGVKRYVLMEEAVIPSHGYDDAALRMREKQLFSFWPFGKAPERGPSTEVRSREEMAKIILGKDSVKEAMA